MKTILDYYYLWPKRSAGQSTILIVFVIGIASLLLSLGFSELSVRQVQVSTDTSTSKKAYYAATAGIDDVIFHLKYASGFGDTPITINSNSLALDGAHYDATTSALSAEEKIATSSGKFGQSIKTIEIKVKNSIEGTGFISAVQTGNGGFEMEKAVEICEGDSSSCTGDTSIYSNGDILGEENSGFNVSKIRGWATAFGKIDGLSGGDGPYITKDASASSLIKCKVDGLRKDTSSSAPSGCSGGTWSHVSPGPPVIDLPDFDADFWREESTNATLGGGTYVGNCVIGGSPDCSSGPTPSPPILPYSIGPKKIQGNLEINSNSQPTITGPLYVTGTLTVDSNNSIELDQSFDDKQTGTVILADGDIITNSNVQYPANGLAVLMVVSAKDYSPSWSCNTPSIQIDNNTKSVIFYALKGCVFVRNNSNFFGALVGQKVHISHGSNFYYNSLLKNAKFGVSAGGGWLITGWRDVE